jgi:hypothetical protein|tara:strand:- start:129 stop:386 length:258 start_codon:yes stop_codon:yes gene_type:complete
MTYKLTDLPNVALLVVVGAVVIGIGATVTSELSADLTTNSTAQSAVDNGTEALANIGKKMPLIGTIVALAIILGVVFSALMFRTR